MARQRKLALVIGIGEYGENIDRLSNPENDAEDMKSALETFDRLSNPENDAEDMKSALESIGFTVTMKLHLKRAEMQKVLVDFENSIKPGDMILFYFAGHGIQWEVRL
jgi:uncharacterized caspase-like protein